MSFSLGGPPPAGAKQGILPCSRVRATRTTRHPASLSPFRRPGWPARFARLLQPMHQFRRRQETSMGMPFLPKRTVVLVVSSVTIAPGRNRQRSHALLHSQDRLEGCDCRRRDVSASPAGAVRGQCTSRLGHGALHRLARRGTGDVCHLRHALPGARQCLQQRAADRQRRHQLDRLFSARSAVRDRPGHTGRPW